MLTLRAIISSFSLIIFRGKCSLTFKFRINQLIKIQKRIDLILYAIFPGVVMLTCSAIIIYKIFDTNKKLKTHGNFNEQISRKRLSKNKQITYLLLTTNLLFLILVSPLVAFNALHQIHEETVRGAIIYFLSYSNHA